MTLSTRGSFWLDYFRKLRERDTESEQLGFSNEEVMIQNVAFILEASGSVIGRRVLDCGCGSGRLARVYESLGGIVTAFDPLGERIEDLKRRYPDVTWAESTIAQWYENTQASLNPANYDIVVASEVLQHVGTLALTDLFGLVAPGGRLIVTVPNADCPIVAAAAAKFGGHYEGVSLSRVPDAISRWLPEATLKWRGLSFQDDQSTGPYIASDWNRALDVRESSHVNRILIVAFRF